MDNFLLILAVSTGAFVVAFAYAALSSERVRRKGLFSAVWWRLSRTSRYRNPYQG